MLPTVEFDGRHRYRAAPVVCRIEFDDGVRAIGDSQLAIVLDVFGRNAACCSFSLLFGVGDLRIEFAGCRIERILVCLPLCLELSSRSLGTDEEFVERFDLEKELDRLIFKVGLALFEAGDLFAERSRLFGCLLYTSDAADE